MRTIASQQSCSRLYHSSAMERRLSQVRPALMPCSFYSFEQCM
jgi:hypothetical protein